MPGDSLTIVEEIAALETALLDEPADPALVADPSEADVRGRVADNLEAGLGSAQLLFRFAYLVKELLIVLSNVFFHQVIHIHIGGLKGFGVGEIAPALGFTPEHGRDPVI